MSKPTLVIGASENHSRYSAQAIKMLQEYNHTVYGIGGRPGEVHGLSFGTEHLDVTDVHTVTLYINPSIQPLYYNYVIGLKPNRVIFNPGTENPEFVRKLVENKIDFEHACTLVMLRTGQF
jgi:predicted CoA-binding protein